jgi:hypothetical protein
VLASRALQIRIGALFRALLATAKRLLGGLAVQVPEPASVSAIGNFSSFMVCDWLSNDVLLRPNLRKRSKVASLRLMAVHISASLFSPFGHFQAAAAQWFSSA